nr:PucR family transcriptional regulator [Microbacterium sp. ZXX196]
MGALLARRELGLRAVTAIGRERLDAPLSGVHSSDLADPTPFLDAGIALLTTGAQFARGEPADAYVERLVARGLAGLGYGVGVVHPGVPDDLRAACEHTGLPLFEVPLGTPFLAVARATADALAAHAFARRSWALAAQRAVSLAALRSDPLPAAIAELAHQLGAWTGLFDAMGALAVARPAPLDADTAAALTETASGLLDRGVRAADTIVVAGRPFTLQTLGRGGALRGVLVVEGASLDQEARGVVTTVVAMAGFALERAVDLARGQAALRAGALRALVSGDTALAADIARAAWGGLPAEPLRAWVVRGDGADLLAALEVRAGQAPGETFFAPDGEGDTVLLAAADADPARALAERFGARAGGSRPASYRALAAALDEARAAVPARGIAVYAPGASDLFRAPGADLAAAARALLAPLRAHDAARGSDLEGDLAAFFAHDGVADRAAEARGVHRHTLRARLAQASTLLGRDLSRFEDKAVMWAALRAAPRR